LGVISSYFKLHWQTFLFLKILHISPRVPFPPTDGGAIGIYNIVTGAAKAGHEVHLLSVNTQTPAARQCYPHLAFQKSVFINTSLSVIKALSNLLKTFHIM